MKSFFKIVKIFIVIVFVTSLASCSSNDDLASSEGLGSVPKGEIVSLEERQVALTGFSDNQLNSETQKWWKHVISDVKISGPDECGEDLSIEENGYVAFYTNGSLYFKYDTSGSASSIGSWEWTNSNKTAVLISNSLGNQEFTVTYLNENTVVYGSVQSSEGCSAVTYEKFNSPYFE